MKNQFLLLFSCLCFTFFASKCQTNDNLDYYKPGINYNFYTGSFNSVADIYSKQVVKADSIKNFDISGSPLKENYAYLFDGFINILNDGKYTFYTSSDDGSKLYIDSMLIVNNDFLHGMQERSGSIVLKKGIHKIEVDFFNKLGDYGLNVMYSGDNFLKIKIPDSLLLSIDPRLIYQPAKFLVNDTMTSVKLSSNVIVFEKIDGYIVYKEVPGETYLKVIDRVDLKKVSLPKKYEVWITK